jgi:hypothetical protein
MNYFLHRVGRFIFPLTLFLFLGLFMPATPRASKSLLFAKLNKDDLLKYTEQPRIIFVGGSNLSLGLNSHMIKDSLKLNPINTAVNAYVGLKYMLDNVIQYVKDGDIIVLVPEYFHFYKDYHDSSEELLRTVTEVNPEKIKLLNFTQLINTIPLIPKYTLTKINPLEYVDTTVNDVYSVNSYNQYGDTEAHWGKEKQDFIHYEINGKYNPSVMKAIKKFESEIIKKNGVLLISYPCYQDISYLKSLVQISKIEEEYYKNGFTVLGNSKRYMFPDSMMFDTPYHLTKEGVDLRTTLFIEDFKKSGKPVRSMVDSNM